MGDHNDEGKKIAGLIQAAKERGTDFAAGVAMILAAFKSGLLSGNLKGAQEYEKVLIDTTLADPEATKRVVSGLEGHIANLTSSEPTEPTEP